MCARCYATTYTRRSRRKRYELRRKRDVCREVREFGLAQWVGRVRRLSCHFAPRVKRLMCLRSSPARPPRTSRLLSCHRSVGGWHPAVPARCFATLRSVKDQAKHPRSSFGADPLQRLCGPLAAAQPRHVRQIERSQDARAAAAAPVLCRSGAGWRQAHGSRSDVVTSGIMDSGQERGHGHIDANDPYSSLCYETSVQCSRCRV
jgi:hypothetical protein